MRVLFVFSLTVFLLACRPAQPSALMTQILEAEDFSWPAGASAVNDGGARGGRSLQFTQAGTAARRVQLPYFAEHVSVKAHSDGCEPAPNVTVRIDGQTVLQEEVKNRKLYDYSADAKVCAGPHYLEIAAAGAGKDAKCVHRLLVDTVSFFAAPVSHGDLRAEDFLPPQNSAVVAEHGECLELGSSGRASAVTELSAPASSVRVRALGDDCQGPPVMDVRIDDTLFSGLAVASNDWIDFTLPVALAAGVHHVDIDFTNDLFRGKACDRNLYLKAVTFLR